MITLDTRDAMRRINATAYIRIAFDVEDPKEYQKLKLLMKHDDGFIAYINGQRVAEKNAPEAPAWNSSATTNSGEADVNEFEVFDITKHLNSLKEGANVLAVHGLNGSTGRQTISLMCQNFMLEQPIQMEGVTSQKLSLEPLNLTRILLIKMKNSLN